MPSLYNAIIELDAGPERAEDVVDALAAYSAAAGVTDRGHLEVVLTIPGETLVQVMQTAVAITAQAIGAHVLTARFIATEEYDTRQGLDPLPEMVSVTEAAHTLGVSRQAVLQRLAGGSLPGRQVGTTWVIPRAALPR